MALSIMFAVRSGFDGQQNLSTHSPYTSQLAANATSDPQDESPTQRLPASCQNFKCSNVPCWLTSTLLFETVIMPMLHDLAMTFVSCRNKIIVIGTWIDLIEVIAAYVALSDIKTMKS
ncbi:hypothetical protein DFJ58DRAFT_846759 [Suillus subalutaceus]|uniref:uncharacterized protein n=1 Tax=Suillus subalutaceus TaxID=48586 RepID=UPI001B864E3E|nr:uncharacterized protein DFJ58DRAFT_846759 [Suillus subalutaceus]KAG1836832.1 hypothetical protein DFJ58DRAFT_846759 [Suillus subalutaceus]